MVKEEYFLLSEPDRVTELCLQRTYNKVCEESVTQTRRPGLIKGFRFQNICGRRFVFLPPLTSPRSPSLLEVQVLECEMRLHDAGGLHPGPQHVLLGGDVLTLGYPLQVVQVTATGDRGVRALVYRCHTTTTLFTGAGQQGTNV